MASKGNSGRRNPQSSREKANRQKEREKQEERRKKEKRDMKRRETQRKKKEKDEDIKDPEEPKKPPEEPRNPEDEIPDVRKDIIDRFTDEKNWFHASHDKYLMSHVYNWVDRMEEWLGTELIEGWKILAYGLESADNDGTLEEIQQTTYTGNFDRKMAELLPYLWDASYEGERWEEIIRETRRIDEELANAETGENFQDFDSEESEEYQNRFGI